MCGGLRRDGCLPTASPEPLFAGLCHVVNPNCLWELLQQDVFYKSFPALRLRDSRCLEPGSFVMQQAKCLDAEVARRPTDDIKSTFPEARGLRYLRDKEARWS